ncbi:FxLYD domain-containing protein [Niallia taxi]|uniref:FxLYD domain-containing protein n=1 Tax=Niallia taxi TaxID=2499688 RepID=UPI0015F36A5F|nr:FxLYD domain-containing protein [Niallia taxi]
MTKKVKIISSICISLLVILGVYTYIEYNKLDLSNINKLEEDLSESLYATAISIEEDEDSTPIPTDNGEFFFYKVIAYATEDFSKLPDEEKVDAMINIARRIDYFLQEDSYIKIGNNKYADIRDIQLIGVNDDSIYSIAYSPGKELNDFVLAASTEENGIQQTKTVSSEEKYGEKTDPNVEITSHKANIDGKYIYVKGTVKNTSPYPLSFIEIKASYYNDEGKSLDTETTYVNSSSPLLVGEQKSFEVMTEMINEKYTKYKVEIIGYKN